MKIIHWNLVDFFPLKLCWCMFLLSAWEKWACATCNALYHARVLSLSPLLFYDLHIATVLNSYKFSFFDFFCLIHCILYASWTVELQRIHSHTHMQSIISIVSNMFASSFTTILLHIVIIRVWTSIYYFIHMKISSANPTQNVSHTNVYFAME